MGVRTTGWIAPLTCAFRNCEKSSTTTPTIRSASKPFGGAATYLLPTRGVNIEAGVYLPLFAIGTVDSRHRLRSEEHTSELQSRGHLVCRLLLEKKKTI